MILATITVHGRQKHLRIDMSQIVLDRIRNFGGGTDSFRPASEIDPNQSQDMVNMIVRDNYECRTRPGADQIDSTPTSFDNIDPTGIVQGLVYYNSPGVSGTINPFDGLVLAEGGYLYTWTSTWSDALSPATALHDAAVSVTMEQGLDKLLISDGVNVPQIFCGDPTYTGGGYTTGFVSCGAAGNTNLPAGATILCWCAGRMFASGYEIQNDLILGSNLLAFGAGQWNLTTQSFRIGDGDGQAVVSMLPFQEQIMAVLKTNSIWLLDCNSSGTIPTSPTYNWSAQEQGDRIGSGIGCCGKKAACNYMNDVLFMSNPTGVHSIQRMQAAAGQYQLSEPMSLPIQKYIDRINWSYASGIIALKYKHYAFFFVPLDNATYNNYALVWNGHLYNPISGTFGQWTGVFTGWTPTAVCVSRINKLVQLVIGNHDGTVNYWKDSPTILSSDSTYLDNGAAIPWHLDTRALNFQNPDNPKQLAFWLLRFNEGNAVVNFDAFMDLSDGDIWSSQLAPGGATLPTVLPFILTSVKPTKLYRSSLGLPFCDEAYYRIGSAGGWAAIRSITAGAFIQPIRDPNS